MVDGWYKDGTQMVAPESEKLTINMNVVDLGQIDLLVEEGFYSNRTDFIRTAIRNQLNTYADAVKQTITRREFALGALSHDRKDLELIQDAGRMLDIKVVGLAVLTNDITPELARATIQSIQVYGIFRASDAVKAALADRIKK
jgi:Arc/MetJ-type ribon-helix-helix transcriptional regulator